MSNGRVVVVGAGVGGLASAAVLARAGLHVTVLEAHVYPGGCAGTFYHQGYRFDAGATLAAGFYPEGPMDVLANVVGVDAWPAVPSTVPMVVHLPDGSSIERRGDVTRHASRRAAFGPGSDRFWQWQERTADAMWSLAMQGTPWPPQSPREWRRLLEVGRTWMPEHAWDRHAPTLAADLFRPVSAHLGKADRRLRQFVDAQLLISAQATSERVNALYGASALDLPRRGAAHLRGGMGAIAEALTAAVRASGGTVLFKRSATRVVMEAGRPKAVEAGRYSYDADIVVANLLPSGVARILGDAAPRRLRRAAQVPRDGWGAFTLYLGVDDGVFRNDLPLHHQVVVGEPLGDGNSLFLSISPPWDSDRAPDGRRAVTISTHTSLEAWWSSFEQDRAGYERQKAAMADRVLASADRVFPGLREASYLALPGTPVTFQRFTRRQRGWVGGYPQTHLLRTVRPRIVPGIWQVGDSVFPGQSTAAVALGGIRVAADVLEHVGVDWPARIAPRAPRQPLDGDPKQRLESSAVSADLEES